MKITQSQILKLERLKRSNLVNTISGIKPVNLIGTVSGDGVTNLAVFNSVIHIGANPPLLGFIIRPYKEVRRDTYENIMETGYYTINNVNEKIVKQAHYTSAKFDKDVSEFTTCNLTEEYIQNFIPPFVKESHIKIGMKFVKQIPIDLNETSLIIGAIEFAEIADQSVDERGIIDHAINKTVGVAGLNTYYSIEKIAEYPYARKEELPEF